MVLKTHDMQAYGQYIACAHFVFVAIVIAFVVSKKEYDRKAKNRRPVLPACGASAPISPVTDDMGAFAFSIDKTQDFMKVWRPRQRVFAAT
jgi:hypothetical protein